MKTTFLLNTSVAFALLVTSHLALAGNDDVEHGKYLAKISGCHDCHTAGYAQTAGNIPESQLLTGSVVGFAGPWGVSYPTNLRNLMASLSEDQWLDKVSNMAKQPPRPPMPWFNLRDMSKNDLRALYQYMNSLGAAGEDAPLAAPPGVAVKTPYIDFMPKNLPAS